MNEMLQLSADYFFCIGVSTPPLTYGIVKNNMANVNLKMVDGFTFPSPAPIQYVHVLFQMIGEWPGK